MQTKKIFLVSIIGALLLAGLYFFVNLQPGSPKILKPSQLDFTKSNQIQEPKEDKPQPPELPQEALVNLNYGAFPASLSQADAQLWEIVQTILITKNDNDPRAKELKNLSANFRKELVAEYSTLKPEDRNGRGFIIFLIAKELKSASDLDFLQKVYQEQPCLSLENCSTTSRDDNPHTSGIDQTTMNYPQLVALYQIDRQLTDKPELLNDPAMRAGILATLKQAEAFPVPAVHDRASQIRQKYNL